MEIFERKEMEINMTMLTINEVARKTGLSSYEIRKRVHAGRCPHIRSGVKVLILFDEFMKQLKDESTQNMTDRQTIIPVEQTDAVGHGQLRQIN